MFLLYQSIADTKSAFSTQKQFQDVFDSVTKDMQTCYQLSSPRHERDEHCILHDYII